MSRHRDVRKLNYDDERDEYEVYGHSVEDDFGVSPSTERQFLYDRNAAHHAAHLSSFVIGGEIPEEEEEESGEESTEDSSLRDSFSRPSLSDFDQARLNSCLEAMRNILGDSTAEHLMTTAAIESGFDPEKAVNIIFNQQGAAAPKPQRQPRNRKNRGGRPPMTSQETCNATVRSSADPVEPVIQAKVIKVESAESGITQPIARMTFSSGKPLRTGFRPEDFQDTPKTKVDNGPEGLETNPVAESESACRLKPEPMEVDSVSPAVTPIHRSASKAKLEKVDFKKEYEKRKGNQGKESINLVVIGHVDAGKSTLMGHLLFQLGFVNKRTMHKYEQESKKLGKASFAYAWVLDETEEERSRGVTMDVAQTRFETDSKIVALLDAPGHKDFIPNMITGAAQADVAILVVNATRGEFETGFEAGGQTREHAMLIRSLGVSQLVVAVNKMDTVEWSETRYQEIVKKLGHFLKQAGFKESDVFYIPCSGLSGENLTKPPAEPRLQCWYNGDTLFHQIDKFRPPERPIEKPFRLCVTDIFKGMGSGFSVTGTVQSGAVAIGDRLVIMPQGEVASVKSITIDETPAQCAFAGDNSALTITGIDMNNIWIGSILCDSNSPIKSASRLKARVVIFNVEFPITKGFPVVFHYQSLSEPALIKKLISQLHKSSGEVIRKKPRCLTKNSSALIELQLSRPVCIELYKDFKDLGRFMLRYAGTTIAAGLVTEIIDSKGNKSDG